MKVFAKQKLLSKNKIKKKSGFFFSGIIELNWWKFIFKNSFTIYIIFALRNLFILNFNAMNDKFVQNISFVNFLLISKILKIEKN